MAPGAVPTCSSKSIRKCFSRVRVRSLGRRLAQIVGTALVGSEIASPPVTARLHARPKHAGPFSPFSILTKGNSGVGRERLWVSSDKPP